MIDDHGPSYWRVFAPGGKEPRVVGLDDLRGGPKGAEITKGLPSVLHDTMLRSLSGGVGRECEAFMRAPVFDRLLDAAVVLKDLHQYTDAKRYPADKEVHKAYTLWKGQASTKPTIDVVLGGRVVATLDIEIGLVYELRGAVLRIRAGRVWGVVVGRVLASGYVKLEGREVHKTDQVQALPGFTLESAEGIPIPRVL